MEEESRVQLIDDIKHKLLHLCQIDMCVLVLAHHFMIYMSNIELLKDRVIEYLDTLVTGLITRWATLHV